jgi:hypothetical protein
MYFRLRSARCCNLFHIHLSLFRNFLGYSPVFGLASAYPALGSEYVVTPWWAVGLTESALLKVLKNMSGVQLLAYLCGLNSRCTISEDSLFLESLRYTVLAITTVLMFQDSKVEAEYCASLWGLSRNSMTVGGRLI